MSQQMIDAFIEKNGTLEDWQGDKVERNTSMGFFFEGWLACQKAAEQKRVQTALRSWLFGWFTGALAGAGILYYFIGGW